VVGTPSTSPFALTPGTDTVLFTSGANTVSGTDTTLGTADKLNGDGSDTLSLTLNAATNFNFGTMTGSFVGFSKLALAANPGGAVSLTFGNANILSGQTLTVDAHLDTSQAFTANASGVTDGGNFIFIAAGNASNALTGGSGNDTFEFLNANLAATDTVNGGPGTDTLWITDASGFTVQDAAFTNVTNTEILKVGGTGTDVLNLGANASHDAGGAGHTLTIDDTTGTGPLTVSGSAMTANMMIELTSTNFNSGDHITGGSGADTVQLVDTGITVGDSAFASVTSIETLKIGGAGANSVTLGAAASADVGGVGHTFTLDDSTGSGALTVDGHLMTANLTIDLTSANFTSSDHITGGSGSDMIQLVDSTGMVVTDAAFTNVTSIETLKLGGAADNSVTLGAHASADVGGAGHTFTLDDSAGLGNLFLDASAMTADLKVLAGAGTELLTGGSGNDTFFAGIGNDIFTGGAGNNVFAFNSLSIGNDQITDFNNTSRNDHIQVSAAGFGGGLTAGEDVTSVFQTAANSTFTSSTERFQFDTANHTLYYSATGSVGTPIALAQLEAGVTLHPTDLHVVA
jgi:Ca2+-binding RTX toxin-like protein